MFNELSPTAPIVTNEKGTKQSDNLGDFDLIDISFLVSLAKRLKYGRIKYGKDNWRGISADDHFNHMMAHALAMRAGDTVDEHSAGFACRAMMFFVAWNAENLLKRKRKHTRKFTHVGDFHIEVGDLHIEAGYKFVPVLEGLKNETIN